MAIIFTYFNNETKYLDILLENQLNFNRKVHQQNLKAPVYSEKFWCAESKFKIAASVMF